jgi:nucleotide-binding universal stress UspA family protein
MAVAVRRVLGARRPSSGYERILVPLLEADAAVTATAVACRLAADRGAVIVAVAVVEVPRELPLDADMTDEEARCFELLRLARAEADRYGVTLEPRLVRGRHAGEEIVEEARRAGAELIVLQVHPRSRAGRGGALFASSAAWVLQRAPCRVLVAAPRG